MKKKIINNNNVEKYMSDEMFAPILNSFCQWVLDNVIEKKNKKIYFLARDGYIPYRIALKNIQMNNKYSQIECKYLYFSRLSLELPYYYATDYSNFPQNIISNKDFFLKICELTQEEQTMIERLYIEKKSLNNDINVISILKRESLRQFHNFIKYLEQNEVFFNKEIIIVDSGWLGNIQKKISTIVLKSGKNNYINGYYFALYNYNNAYGKYNAYYFSKEKISLLRRSIINCDIFETIVSEQCGVTLSYKEIKNDKVIPLLDDSYSKNIYKEKLQKYILENNMQATKKDIDKIFMHMIFGIENEILEYFQKIFFSKNIYDSEKNSLVQKINFAQAIFLLYPLRFFENKEKLEKTYWIEGNFAYSFKGILKNVLILSAFLCNIVRNFIKYILK